MKDKLDLPGAILVAALLLAGVGALALSQENLGTTLIGLAIGIVVPSPLRPPSGGGSGGVSGAAVLLVCGLLTLQGCSNTAVPPGLAMLVGVLCAIALGGSGVLTFAKRAIAGFALLLVVGCTGATVPAYAVTTTACVSAEQSVVRQSGSTLEADESALRAIRELCDAILASIRALANDGDAS